ncbi:DUF6631 family protein [Spectribacter hydrogenooxidans]|uniref:DUF6631 family protein n=1 Tax=Spectribacter hydrogenoxidans TaxID=3075608 RepID=A0ABU3C0M2_9GAMM|nr:DUF6631 family protein [Salinisphaera sp. W335]MDT0635102.1 DUF6631 family protein [Salinisphaera sp. W335]
MAEENPRDTDGDAAILQPDTDITLAGETVTVRRFRYGESLKAQKEAEGLLTALAEMPADATLQSILDLIASHPDDWLRLMARSTGRDVDWLADLHDADGHNLALTVWQVNQSFFRLRLMTRGLSRTLRQAPSTSSASLSKPDTDRSTTSPSDTPSPSSGGSPSATAGAAGTHAPS